MNRKVSLDCPSSPKSLSVNRSLGEKKKKRVLWYPVLGKYLIL